MGVFFGRKLSKRPPSAPPIPPRPVASVEATEGRGVAGWEETWFRLKSWERRSKELEVGTGLGGDGMENKGCWGRVEEATEGLEGFERRLSMFWRAGWIT